MTDAGLVKTNVNGLQSKRLPKIRRITQSPIGVTVTVSASGVSAGAADFRAKADKIRHGFGCRDIKATQTGPTIQLDLRWEDPFRRTVRFVELPVATKPLHATVGITEDGEPVEKDIRLANLIIGAPGSGKSTEAWAFLAALTQARIPFRLRVFDPKGGQEFVELEGAAYDYERNPLAWPLFLERALSALGSRQAALRRSGTREVLRPTTENPLDVMVIDELMTALAFGGADAKVKVDGKSIKAEQAFRVYLSTCRSGLFTCIALSQLGQKEVIGPIRGLFGNATCLRVGPTEKELVDIMLGSGASQNYQAHELPNSPSSAGIGWVRTDAGVVKFRGALLTDADRAKVVREIKAWSARLRPAGRDAS